MIGVDEVGVSPVLGSLYAVAVKSDNIDRMDLKDSKKLSEEEIQNVYPELIEDIDYNYFRITPSEFETRSNLQEVVLKAHYHAIEKHDYKNEEIYVDACTLGEEEFGERLSEMIDKEATIISRHKADERFPIVSAASIIAKALRIHEMNSLRSKYDYEIGSGYSDDPKTRDFIFNYISENSEIPEDARKEWKLFDNL
jgi:ribonuclease HII